MVTLKEIQFRWVVMFCHTHRHSQSQTFFILLRRSTWGLIQKKQNFPRSTISRWTQEVSLQHVLWHSSMLTSSGVLNDSVVWIKRGFAVDPPQHTGYKSQCEAGAVTTAHLSSYTHMGSSPVGPVAKRVQSMWPQVLDLKEFWSSRRILTAVISWLAAKAVFSLDTCPGKFQLMGLMTQTSADWRPAVFTFVAGSRRHRAQLEERIPVVKEGLKVLKLSSEWILCGNMNFLSECSQLFPVSYSVTGGSKLITVK